MIRLMSMIIIALLLVLHSCYSQLSLMVGKYTINAAAAAPQSLVSKEIYNDNEVPQVQVSTFNLIFNDKMLYCTF